jgi:hypothetical protein
LKVFLFGRNKNMTGSDKKPESKITMNFTGSVSGVAGEVHGNQININKRQDLSESMLEIQKILEQFVQNSQSISLSPGEEAQVQAALVKINKNPTLRERFLSALKSGSTETLKEVFQHPAVNIGVAVYEGWTNP